MWAYATVLEPSSSFFLCSLVLRLMSPDKPWGWRASCLYDGGLPSSACAIGCVSVGRRQQRKSAGREQRGNDTCDESRGDHAESPEQREKGRFSKDFWSNEIIYSRILLVARAQGRSSTGDFRDVEAMRAKRRRIQWGLTVLAAELTSFFHSEMSDAFSVTPICRPALHSQQLVTSVIK